MDDQGHFCGLKEQFTLETKSKELGKSRDLTSRKLRIRDCTLTFDTSESQNSVDDVWHFLTGKLSDDCVHYKPILF